MESSTLLMLIAVGTVAVRALDNGLARTPPMGWLSWERFRCNLDCLNDPDNCISENLYMRMADIIAAEGYKDAGYQYVCIDDCWLSKSRDSNGRLQPDPDRFPHGMKALADYIHSKGLKIGIYEDVGSMTCAKYPGSEGHYEIDAQTFAEWGIDLLKFDGCNINPDDFNKGYRAMGFYLNQTGRPIVYSCEWALGDVLHRRPADYKAVLDVCNTCRNYNDINDQWESIANVINYYAKDVGNFSKIAGPGGWNDPDEMVIGDFSLSPDQERTQMALWSMWAAPLLMSVDLRNIRPESKNLLLNKGLIAVNQDPLGVPGSLRMTVGQISIWTRPILPKGSFAAVMFNTGQGGAPRNVTVPMYQLVDGSQLSYLVTDTFTGSKLAVLSLLQGLTVRVNPTGVVMVTITPA
ncbi:alpha-galactosidase A-like [Haliotis rufescens]|uniref:alpha-galactosidase A-like n=1 Tax=Haliotis rufescens TaxID=6454 RepID=UPI00201EC8EE|nr:alpha-galactosidase A-like [Haliotis rufescens]XP_046362791.2 alpha-galactosidase A-like [Haliotis rufescens]XP_046362792.2 alpha-galactosidase A-like [Haliotis rufescens]